MSTSRKTIGVSKPKEKELEKDKLKKELEEFNLREKALDRRLRARVDPSPITKFFNAINPQTSLGKRATTDFEEHSLTISLILVFTLVIGIISIFMYQETIKDGSDVGRKEQHEVLTALVISWFIFTNFFFLIFGATRLLHLLLFIAILALIGDSLANIDKNSKAASLGMAIIGLATIPLSVLLYFYVYSDSDEITKIKTLENERLRKEKFAALIEQKCKLREEKAIKALENRYKEEYGIRQRLSESLISSIESGRYPGGGSTKKKDSDKDKKPKEEETE